MNGRTRIGDALLILGWILLAAFLFTAFSSFIKRPIGPHFLIDILVYLGALAAGFFTFFFLAPTMSEEEEKTDTVAPRTRNIFLLAMAAGTAMTGFIVMSYVFIFHEFCDPTLNLEF